VVVVAEPVRLTAKTITKLTDAASALFRLFYDLEEAQKLTAKDKLRKTLAETDVFRNSTEHEEWRGE
jgi:hypothetical protein